MLNTIHKIRILGTAAALMILLGACSKSFINGIKPTNSADTSQVFASTNGVRTYFNGIYRTMRSQWQSTDQSAGGQTDTWGYNSIFLARDVKGKDIVMPYANWYYFDYQNINREPTYRRTNFVWYFFYELINQLNVLIQGTQNSADIIPSDKTMLIAEARGLRAYLYFELIREFQLTYAKNPSLPGVPIYTTPDGNSDSARGAPRGTMQQTYDQINADISYAVQNAGTNQLLPDQVNLNVAWGMAARIYLEQQQWANAETAARNALQGHSLDAAGYPSNYNGLTSPEIIWGFPQTTGDGGQSLYYGTPSSFFEQTGQGYDAFWMSQELVSHFSKTDVRNTFYIYDPTPGAADYLATNKFGSASPYQVDLLNGQTVTLNMTNFNESLNFMRAGEMYLVLAEAAAQQGKPYAADTLFHLQVNRDPNATPSHNTGQALINEILLERRKELYGELGIDWTDAKRTQQPIDRTGSNHPSPYNYVIPANDPRFCLKIPLTEIQSNKRMSPADQNP